MNPFEEQARHCEGRSSLYAELCRRFARDPVAAEIVEGAEAPRVALSLLSGLHYLVLRGEASWDDPLERHRDFLYHYVRTQGVQTNEVQRSWVLLPLFLHALRGVEELDVIELGSSAGLNLVWDRYRYEYERGTWGPDDAPLTLRGEERSPVPSELLAHVPHVRSRVGIDRAPIDVTTEDGALLLEAFVWAGQHERVARLRAAIEAVRADPPKVVAGDIADVLPDVLAGLPRDRPTLVFQTSVFEYLTEDTRAYVREILDQADRDLVFVASGAPRAGAMSWGMRIYRPGRDRQFVGHADYHGAWLDYEL